MKLVNPASSKLNSDEVLQFSKLNRFKKKTKHLKVRGLFSMKKISNGNSRVNRYKVKTSAGFDYFIAPDKDQIYYLDNYINKIVVVTGVIGPGSDYLQLISLSLPNPPLTFANSKKITAEEMNINLYLKQFDQLLSMPAVAA